MREYRDGRVNPCYGCDEDTNIHSDIDTAQLVEDMMIEDDYEIRPSRDRIKEYDI